MVTKFKKYTRKESRQSLFSSVLMGMLILIVIAFLVIANWKIDKKREEFNLKIDALKEEIQTLEKRKQELQAGISQSGTESYFEKEAREKLGLKRPGEEVAVVLPAQENQEKEGQEQKSFWQKILEILNLRD